MQEYIELLAHATENVLNYFYLKKRQFPEPCSLEGKVIVITGANRSAGKQTAIECASRGAHVVLACRNVALAERVQQEIIESGYRVPIIIQVDLCSFESIKKATNELTNKLSRIDVLIHNAGMIASSREITINGIESTVQANYVGQVLLTENLLSMFNQSSDPRVIFVSSLLHHAAWKEASVSMEDFFKQEKFSPTKAYAESKAASLMYCRKLSEQNPHIKCYSVDPGIFESDIVRDKPRWMDTWIAYSVMRVFLRSASDAAASIMAPLFLPGDLYDTNAFYYGDGRAKKCSEIIFNDQLCEQVLRSTRHLLSHHLTTKDPDSLSSM